MTKFGHYLVVLFVYSLAVAFANEGEDIVCPTDEHLKPCYCDSYTIRCDEEDTEIRDLSVITTKVEDMTNNSGIVFAELAVLGVNMLEIGENSLGKLMYNRIAIVDTGLRRIHPNAFHATSPVTDYIDLERNSLDDSVFNALRSLPNLQWISLSHNKLEIIPSYAFRHTNGRFQSRLRGIFLMGNAINTISGHAFFYLPHLRMLNLVENRLSAVSENSFAFEDIPIGRDNQLTIDLSRNALHSNSFLAKALQTIHRPVRLKFDGNNVTHLDEMVFKQFLHTNGNNTVDLHENPLTCQCSSRWLHKEMHFFRKQIVNHKCVDNRLLWDYQENEFSECDE